MGVAKIADDASGGEKALSSRGLGWRSSTLAALVLLALAALAVYHNSLSVPFIFDDRPSIVENSDIRHFVTTLRENAKTDSATAVGRPLLRISLWINYALGGLSVLGYHVVNLLLHVLAAFTLFGLARRLLESPRLRDRYGRQSWGLALAIALLWTTHPLQTESVTYVVQRAETLGAGFYLLTLYGVARSAGAADERPWTWSVFAVVSCLLGMASKETVATAPLLALALDRIFFARSWKALWQSRRGLYLALACTWIFQAMLVVASSGRKASVGFGLSVSWWQYALTQPYYLCRYLALSVWPSALTLDYGTYLARSVGEVVPYAAVVLLLLALTLVGLWRNPPMGFCGLWFFLILAPTSSVVPVTTQTGAEHRMYLPLAGLLGLVVVAGYTVLRRMCRERPGLLRVACVLAVAVGVTLLAARTVARNEDYRSELSVWATVVDRWPVNPRAHQTLGLALANAGRLPEAITQYEEALRFQPNLAGAHVDLGCTLASMGRLPEAIDQFEEALRLQPDYPGAHLNLGNTFASMGRLQEAIAQYETALRIQPDYAEAYLNLGNALSSAARLAEAIAQYEAALRLKPDYVEAHNNLGNALLSAGRTPEAIAQYEAALRLTPDYVEAQYNLGNALLSAGRTPEAIAQFEEALRLKPDYVEAHYNLGNALLSAGRIPEAIAQYEAALRLKPDFANAHNNLGSALLSAGRIPEAIAQLEEALRLKPEDAEAHYNMGNALVSAGRIPEAIAQLEEALSLKPNLAGGPLPEAIAQLKAALLVQQQQRGGGSSSEADGAP